MRQQLKEVASKVLAISLSKTSSFATPTANISEAELASFTVDQQKQNPLNAPALDLETWLDFNKDLERDKKFAYAVVNIFCPLFFYCFRISASYKRLLTLFDFIKFCCFFCVICFPF